MGQLLDAALTKLRSSVSSFSPKHRTSISPSFVYPLFYDILPLRSTLKFDFSAVIKSFSTVKPVFGRYDIRYNVFIQDLAAYSYNLSRNGEVIGYDGSLVDSDNFDVKTGLFSRLPVRSVIGTSDSSVNAYLYNSIEQITNIGDLYKYESVHPSSLDCYLGLPANYLPLSGNGGLYGNNNTVNKDVVSTRKSAIFELMYLDIIRNYYVNRQFGYAPFAGWISKTVDGVAGYYPGYNWCSIKELDDFFNDVYVNQAYQRESSGYDITSSSRYPYKVNIVDSSGLVVTNHASVPHGKLFLSCYNPDINNSWLSVKNYQNMTSLAAVNTSGSTVLFQSIVGVSHQQRFLQKLFLSGGLMSDWLFAEYGRYGKDSCPRLIHTSKDEFVFDDVISNASTEGADLGERGGLGYGGGFGSVPSIHTGSRYMVVMITMTLTPNVDYFQGVDYRLNVTDLGRFPMPDFDSISMQPRLYEQLNAVAFLRSPSNPDNVNQGYYVSRPTRADYLAASATDVVFPGKAAYAVGYQFPYSEWRTDFNRVTGDMCDSMRDWVFLRDFQFGRNTDWSLNDESAGFIQLNTFPYIFPEEYQYVFNSGETSEGVALDNFQLNFKVIKGRKVLPIRKGVLPKVV